MDHPQWTIVNACTRDGRGGSPTAIVVDDATLTDRDRQAVPGAARTSHAAFLTTGGSDVPTVRFFTAEGELKNCGHGTIAAQAFLLNGGDASHHAGHQRTGDRTFATTATRRREGVEVWFDQGIITLQDCADGQGGRIVAALGLRPDDVAEDGLRVASPGTPRLLVRLRSPAALESIRLDSERLATECRRLGYLGCFTYVTSPTVKMAVARMFAPAIGVVEDVMNANSAGCLAAHLLDATGDGTIEVRQGDSLNRPSSVRATATHTRNGISTRIGGMASIVESR